MTGGGPLGWLGIFRLGLIQAALGSIVVLTTSTFNRIMAVELALPAMLPGALVALHYAVQILRPRLGYGSDLGGRRSPWIAGGMAVLAGGGVLAAVATAWMGSSPVAGILLGIFAYALIGLGVGACGTVLLVLLADRVDERHRAGAATVLWLMLILGFVVTAATVGHFLDPYSPTRLVVATAWVAVAAVALTLVALRGMEGSEKSPAAVAAAPDASAFGRALAEVWSEPQARRFTVFVFVSMLAYSAQDLILEPFAGTLFGFTPGESTKLSGTQNGGAFVGMLLLAVLGTTAWGRRLGSLKTWTILGCIASAAALATLAAGGFAGPGFPLKATVFALGLANGLFAIAAIGSMMGLVGSGFAGREGVRMGLWGAAQAVAIGAGGFIGTLGVDVVRFVIGSPAVAYGAVFASEAVLFLIAAGLAAGVSLPSDDGASPVPSGAIAETL
jgi:MFS transporter, BCD family, chlorophyll transporter